MVNSCPVLNEQTHQLSVWMSSSRLCISSGYYSLFFDTLTYCFALLSLIGISTENPRIVIKSCQNKKGWKFVSTAPKKGVFFSAANYKKRHQNEFMKSSFLSKFETNIVKISPLEFLVGYKIKKHQRGDPYKLSNINVVPSCWNFAQLKEI